MKNIKKIVLLSLVASLFFACGKDEFEPYDQAYIHIMKNEVSKVSVSARARVVSEYPVYLSSGPLRETLMVDFSITPGDGLKAGTDYEIVTSGNTLSFLPGIYDMPIRIRWLPHSLDPSKNNTLVIRIESNSMDLTMGLPGKDQYQRELTITKTN